MSTRRIVTVSITPSANSVSGTFTTACVEQVGDKWQESDPMVQPITPTAEGFTLSNDGLTFTFTVDQYLRDQIDEILEEYFSKPVTAKKVQPRPSTKNPHPKPFWLAYADDTATIVCSAGQWVVRPGLRWADPKEEPFQVWLINRRTSVLRFAPTGKVKFA